MERLEEQLRRAMEPADPGEGFASRVMARIAREQRAAETSPRGLFAAVYAWLGRPALAGGAICVLLAGLVAGGLAWEHRKQALRQEQLETLGRQSSKDLLLALRITGSRLARVQELLTAGRIEHGQEQPRLD